jgi:hypothetical protein
MSTGPGPTRKDDGSPDTSVEDIAELLVEEDGHKGPAAEKHAFDDGLDVMLETPGPVLATTFLPPPPAPAGWVGEEGEGPEEGGASTNLAYEDLLAKLVLPSKAAEPEPTLPVPVAPAAETIEAPADPADELMLPSVGRPSSPSFEVAPPAEERTLVTDNPLVAEEQQAAAREGRASITREQPRVVAEELRPAVTERFPPLVVNGVAKSKLLYLLFGGLLVLGGMVLATVLLKLLMPTPAPQAPVVAAPPQVPQPTPAPPAQVQPLPPTPPPAVAPPPPAQAEPEAAKAAAPAPEEAQPAAEPEKPRPRRREGHARSSRAAAAKPAPATKPAAAPKVAAPAAAAKPAKGGKKSKTSSYADPFDN